MDSIPCEICQELVPFSNYNEHCNNCLINRGRRMFSNFVYNTDLSSFNSLFNRTLNEIDNLSTDNNEEMSEEDINVQTNEDTFDNVNNFVGVNEQMDNNLNNENIATPVISLSRTPINAINISRRIITEIMSEILNEGENIGEDLMELSSRIGVVEKGINNIENVTSIVSDTEKINCPICQTECVSQVRKTLCNHSFCDECISRWLSKSKKCPSCMRDLEDLLEEET